MEVLKVSSKSAPNSVAGAIAGVIREFGCVEVQAVGLAPPTRRSKRWPWPGAIWRPPE